MYASWLVEMPDGICNSSLLMSDSPLYNFDLRLRMSNSPYPTLKGLKHSAKMWFPFVLQWLSWWCNIGGWCGSRIVNIKQYHGISLDVS